MALSTLQYLLLSVQFIAFIFFDNTAALSSCDAATTTTVSEVLGTVTVTVTAPGVYPQGLANGEQRPLLGAG